MNNENKNIIVGDDGSYFDGGYFAYIGYNIAVAFVTGITFGIAHPWMRCWYQKWLASHTVINGKRMTFDGKGGDLFVKYIIWLLLSYVTCGIYYFWMNVALKKWISEHTHFENEPDNNSFFDGRVGDYIITSILSVLALLVPFAGMAWSKIIITRWFINHTVIDSRRLTFRGTVGDLFVKYLLWGILTTITCGIFGLFVPVKYIKWETEHTLDSDFTPEALNAKANYKTQIHTDAVMLQSGDAAQLETVKAQMLTEANEGLNEEDLAKLESAARLFDILNDCGYAFDSSEEELIYNCTLLIRKLKAQKPLQTKSKVWVIVVAAVVAFIMFVGVIGGGIAAATLFLKPVGEGRDIQGEMSSQAFWQRMQVFIMDEFSGSEYDLEIVEETTDGGSTRILKNSNNEVLVTFTVFEGIGARGNAIITKVKIYGLRDINGYNNEENIEDITETILDALYIDTDISVTEANTYKGKFDEFWSYNFINDSSKVNIEILHY